MPSAKDLASTVQEGQELAECIKFLHNALVVPTRWGVWERYSAAERIA